MMAFNTDPHYDANTLQAPENGLALWWLGQAGFLIVADKMRIVIDAYLSDALATKYKGTRFPHHRMMDAPIAPDALEEIDWLLCTHSHTDHMDAETIVPLLAANPRCKVLVPRAVREVALERGVPPDRLTLIDVDETIDLGGLMVTATPAAHENLKFDDDGACVFLGYVLQLGGITIWHSGDTIPFPGLVESIAPQGIDLALLPVNGRDAERASNGVPGNLTLEEAVELSIDIGASATLGHHIELFDFNTLDRVVGNEWLDEHRPVSDFSLVQAHTCYEFQAINKTSRIPRILVVCRGNICRSPTAHGILREMAQDKAVVDSAAIMDWNIGRGPDIRAIQTAARHGYDIRDLIARQVSIHDFHDYDFILAMDEANIEGVEKLRPAGGRALILRLGNYLNTGESFEIEDPYYGDLHNFEIAFTQIEECCQIFIKKFNFTKFDKN